MPRTPYTFPVTYRGTPIDGSPITARLYISTSFTGRRSEVAPLIGHATSNLVISAPVGTALSVGCLADLSGTPYGGFAKIVNVRPYERDIQCDTNRVPYETLTIWRAPEMSPGEDGNVPDAVYGESDSILSYMEPMDEQARIMAFGNTDVRSNRVFTLETVNQNDVIRDSQGIYWIASAGAEYYPVTDDYVTNMRHIIEPPVGVS